MGCTLRAEYGKKKNGLSCEQDRQIKMLPQFYQTHLANRLSFRQLLTLQLLVGLLQFHKQVRIID